MKLDTVDYAVEPAGTFRCCTAAVGLGMPTAKLGDKTQCAHCKEQFTLVELKPGMSSGFRNMKGPFWKPDWQLKP